MYWFLNKRGQFIPLSLKFYHVCVCILLIPFFIQYVISCKPWATFCVVKQEKLFLPANGIWYLLCDHPLLCSHLPNHQWPMFDSSMKSTFWPSTYGWEHEVAILICLTYPTKPFYFLFSSRHSPKDVLQWYLTLMQRLKVTSVIPQKSILSYPLVFPYIPV